MGHRNRGQTVIELCIILVVLGLIATALVFTVRPKLDRARRDQAKLELQNFRSACSLYARRHGRYPDAAGGLRALVEDDFLEAPAKDPWGNDYVYRADEVPPVILSYGHDGQPGGTGRNEDLTLQLHPLPPLPPPG